MIAPPERSPARDAAITAMLPLVGAHGWTASCLRQAIGMPEAELLFPGGAADMVEGFCDLADRHMKRQAAADGRLSERIRAAIALRLHQNRDYKEAVRRAVAVLAHPANTCLAARCTARTVDAIWHAAGDRSADFSWYTKRVILAGIYGATLFYWLQDDDEADAATLAFLDRRLADLARFGRRRRRPPNRPEPAADADVRLTGA